MRLIINGQEKDNVNASTVSELLVDQKVESPDYVSVELNGRILRREEYSTTPVSDGDKVEFLYFMGGGRGTY